MELKAGLPQKRSSPESSLKDLNTTQQSILEIVAQNPAATQMFMAEKLGLTIRAVKKSIKDLTDKDILNREGSARNGRWVIMNKNDRTV
ncbi:MAG TPA: MarR family transcriptional regulator [Clostridiales bacterium]|nr:MarR family transcriptional regulator [Clostridiales bacterium]